MFKLSLAVACTLVCLTGNQYPAVAESYFVRPNHNGFTVDGPRGYSGTYRQLPGPLGGQYEDNSRPVRRSAPNYMGQTDLY